MATTIQTIQKPTRARALDTSGNNNHGQIYSGRALEFDGVSDYFQHNGGTALSGVNQFADEVAWTFATWIYLNDTSSANFFIGNDNSTSPHLIVQSTYADFRASAGGNDYFRFSTTPTSSPSDGRKLNNNTWYRFVVVASTSSTLTLYLNGVEAGTIISTTVGHDDGNTFSADGGTAMEFSGWGASYGSARNHHLDGMMSDGQVWDAAWTADDVAFDYANPEQLALNRGGTSLTNSNLKIWYPMNDGHRGQQSYILDASNTGLGDELLTTTDLTTVGNATIAAGATLNNWTHHATYQYDSVTASSDGIRIVSNGVNDLGSAYQSVHSNNFPTIEGVTYRFEYTAIQNSGGNMSLDATNNPVGSSIILGGANTLTGSVTNEVLYFTADSSAEATCVIDFYIPSTVAADWTISYVSIKPINDKNHATTVFYGDMTALCTDDDSNFGKLYNTANTEFDFTQESTAFAGGDTYDVVANSAFTANNATALIETDNSSTGLEITNTTTAAGEIRSGAITTVVGRTYELALTYYATSESFVDSDIEIGVGTSAGNKALIDATDADGNYTNTFVATTTSTHILIGVVTTTSGHAVRVKTFQLREVGLASGWTDADQQLYIPQTALQSYNQLAWFDGYNNHAVATVAAATGTSDFSFSAWINLNLESGDSNGLARKNGGYATGDPGWTMFISSAGVPNLQFSTADTVVKNGAIANATALTEDKWYHVVGTFNRDGNFTFYTNGEVNGDTTDLSGQSDDSISDGTTLYIGAVGASGNNYPLDGCITEVSYWTTDLSADNVKLLYNDGKALNALDHPSSQLSHYWRNNGLSSWQDLKNDSVTTYNAAPDATETMLITAGADGSRDSQGFLMNRQRTTNSLNLYDDMADGAGGTGSYMAALQSPFTADTDYNAMTVTLWFKTPDNTIRDSLFSIIDDNSTHFTVDTLGTGKFAWTYEGSTAVTDARYKTDADLYSSDKWTFVAFALDHDIGADADRVKCYVGDEDTVVSLRTADTTHTTTTTSPSKDNSLQIGYTEVNTNNFTGQADDVCVYTKTLTLAEITRNYNAGKRSHR